MEGFLKSFQPLWEKFSHEIILISISCILIIISVVIYTKQTVDNGQQLPSSNLNKRQLTIDNLPSAIKIYVEISGAVEKPDVYELKSGARLNDLVKIAGGLTASAEKNYFSRNFNLARILTDQEKIYVPNIYDIANGIFSENQRVLEYLNPQNISSENAVSNEDTPAEKVNINTAEIEELELLPGIGEALAKKIITNRTYADTQELVTKKVITKKVFEAIKNQISLN